MKVIWKGSIELVTGIEKITLEAPAGTEDDLHSLKKAAKRGEELELRVADKQEPQVDDMLTPEPLSKFIPDMLRLMEIVRLEGQREGVEMAKEIINKPEVIHESPERQAEVVKAHDQIQGDTQGMTSFPFGSGRY